MSIASELLKLLGESQTSGDILLSAETRELLEEVLGEISPRRKTASMIVEGSQYFSEPPYKYRKDPPHSPTGFQHWHCYRRNNQVAVVNMNGTGHDGSSGTRLTNRIGDYLRSKGVRLQRNNVIASDLNESFTPRFVVVLTEAELLSLLWP